jgi:hypothetical protein
MISMPKAFPTEFRRDVVAVARNGEAPLSQIGNPKRTPAPVTTHHSQDLGHLLADGQPVGGFPG